jgi:Ser-tRNA(Ala) deacylase AlaX
MTKLIYYQDQYKKEIEAKVVKIEGNMVLLDKTIFIPQTNTEPGDLGKINGIKISGLKKDEKNIWHIIQKQITFQVNDTVKLELDWNKRSLAMKLHSALHLLAGPFDKNFEKRAVAGALRGNQAYLVFKEEVSDEIVSGALKQANEDIENGLEIKSYWDEEREGFRWTQVGNYPPIPDGGLHVKNTNEIGKIKLVSKELKQGKEKITISIE